MRHCLTCQHLKRSEIDRRLAAGEPSTRVARDYDLNLFEPVPAPEELPQAASSNQIMKDVARGTAAIALLPSKESLGSAYTDLQARIDEIVTEAAAAGIARTSPSPGSTQFDKH